MSWVRPGTSSVHGGPWRWHCPWTSAARRSAPCRLERAKRIAGAKTLVPRPPGPGEDPWRSALSRPLGRIPARSAQTSDDTVGLSVRKGAAVTLYPGDRSEYLEAVRATLRPFTCSLPPTGCPALGGTLLEGDPLWHRGVRHPGGQPQPCQPHPLPTYLSLS